MDAIEINIVDQECGSGKTSAAINMINQSSNDERFIYVTPYLDEVERIKKSCAKKKFVTPSSGGKIYKLKTLLNRGKNIVTTHALFHLFDDEIIDICRSLNYVLIMDEVTNVIEPFNITVSDIKLLFEYYIYADDDGMLRWNEDKMNYTGKFNDIKSLIEMEALISYGNQIVVWLFPIKIFKAFRKSYILTYLFDGQMQKYYYDYNNLKYNHIYVTGNTVDDFHFIDTPVEHHNDYSSLINIVDDYKLNYIGETDSAFSKSWYDRNKDNIIMKQIKNNLINFFNKKNVLWDDETQTYIPSNASHNLWTTFKDYKQSIKGMGYTKGFLAHNARATNDWSDRSVVAYMVNRYFNPVLKNFFLANHIEINEDAYALSEMIQFIWRSAIRNGEHITVYVPSKRMRKLLQDHLTAMHEKCYP